MQSGGYLEGVEVKKKAQREWHVQKCEVEDSDSDN